MLMHVGSEQKVTHSFVVHTASLEETNEACFISMLSCAQFMHALFVVCVVLKPRLCVHIFLCYFLILCTAGQL